MIGWKEVGRQSFINIHLALYQEKLTAFYLVQVLRKSRGLGRHIKCHWLHLSLLLMKLFKHNLSFGITKAGKKTWKEDLQLQLTRLLSLSLECYPFHLYVVCVSLSLVFLLLHLKQCCHGWQQHLTIQISRGGVVLWSCVTCITYQLLQQMNLWRATSQ